MRLRPFTDDDIWRIVPQSSQALDDEGRARILGESVPRGPCWTVLATDGRVLGIGGFVFLHAGWATAWTILAADIGAAMVGLTRMVRFVLLGMHMPRIDMHIDPASLASVRWAMALGFRQDAILARALPDGRDMGVWLYERGARG
jgi:RimJ/RimL family protein N-acetyltransferase